MNLGRDQSSRSCDGCERRGDWWGVTGLQLYHDYYNGRNLCVWCILKENKLFKKKEIEH